MTMHIRRHGGGFDWGFDEMATTPYFHQGDEVGVLAMHGFMGTPANMRPVADAAAANGHTVYVPRLSGHGTTLPDMQAQSGKLWVEETFRAYDKLREAGCTRIFLMGLSMGGILMSLVASERPVEGLVLFSTPFKLKKYLILGGRLRAVAPYIVFTLSPEQEAEKRRWHPYNQTYEGAPAARIRDLERLCARARKQLPRIHCPTLMLQSRLDDKVDLRSVDIARERLGSRDVRLIWMEHSPHGCTYGPEREQAAALAAAFVEEQLTKTAENRV